MFPSELICYIMALIPDHRYLLLNKEINKKGYVYWLNIPNKQQIFRKAIEANKPEIVKLLLPSVDPNNAIILASRNGHDQCVDLLLKDGLPGGACAGFGSDPTAQNNYAIIWASANDHNQCVDLLLKDGRAKL